MAQPDARRATRANAPPTAQECDDRKEPSAFVSVSERVPLLGCDRICLLRKQMTRCQDLLLGNKDGRRIRSPRCEKLRLPASDDPTQVIGRLCSARRPTVLSCAVLCCAVLCCAVLCCAALRCAVLCCAVLCCAALGWAGLCCAALRCAALRCAVPCCAALCCCAALWAPL